MCPDATGEPARRLRAERDVYRDAFRRAFAAYLVVGHGLPEAVALAEADRVMAETDRQIDDRSGREEG